MSDTWILIPSRYASKRFPGKPLAVIAGLPMIQRVYQNCHQTGLRTIVVTDNDQIEECVQGFGGEVCRVDEATTSGSERIYLALQKLVEAQGGEGPEYVVNVQGDEPLLSAKTLTDLVQFHRTHSFDVATLVKRRLGQMEQYQNPNIVKVVWGPNSGRCYYFSRSPVPYFQDFEGSDEEKFWFQHIGVYSYKASALRSFCGGKRGLYEKIEGLEQLRAFPLGLKIGAIATDEELIGVDVPEDIDRVQGVLNGAKF